MKVIAVMARDKLLIVLNGIEMRIRYLYGIRDDDF